MASRGYTPMSELDRLIRDCEPHEEARREAAYKLQRQRVGEQNQKSITFRGETLKTGQWAARLGITLKNLEMRLLRYPLDIALSQPPKPGRQRQPLDAKPMPGKPVTEIRPQVSMSAAREEQIGQVVIHLAAGRFDNAKRAYDIHKVTAGEWRAYWDKHFSKGANSGSFR